MNKKIVFLFLMCCLFSTTLRAQTSLSLKELEQTALAYIVRAQQVVDHANRLMSAKPDRQSAEMFVDLYLQASRLYGDASRLLKAIGPGYVRQDTVDQFAQAETECLLVIDEVQRLLNRGELVAVPPEGFSELLRKIKELSR
jgi:CHASE3 domain sensor protein